MSRTLTLEGDVNAVDTRVNLTAQGSVTSPSLVVPSGMSRIKGIVASFAADNLADDGAVVCLIRLGGAAVKNGESVLVIGGLGGQLPQSGSDVAPSVGYPFKLDNLDIEVQPSDTISVSAEIAGVDPGDTTVAVTLIYA